MLAIGGAPAMSRNFWCVVEVLDEGQGGPMDEGQGGPMFVMGTTLCPSRSNR